MAAIAAIAHAGMEKMMVQIIPIFLRNVAINQGSVDITSQKCLIDWQISYEAEISTGIPKSGKELLLITCRVSKDIKKLAATSSSN